MLNFESKAAAKKQTAVVAFENGCLLAGQSRLIALFLLRRNDVFTVGKVKRARLSFS